MGKHLERKGDFVVELVLLGCLQVGVLQAQTVFEPSFAGIAGYEDRGLESSAGSFLGASVSLPLRRTSPVSVLRLNLNASYLSREKERDNLSFLLGLGYQKRLTPRDTMQFAVNAVQTDRPPTLPGDANDPSFLGGREQRTANANVGYRRALGPRTGLGARLEFRGSDFLPLESVGISGEQRSQAALALTFDWARSERDALGAIYGYRYFRFSEAGDQHSHSLGGSFSRLILGKFSFFVALGGWTLTQSDPDPGATETTSGGFLAFSSAANLRRITVSGAVDHGLDAESAVGTVTTLTRVLLNVGGQVTGSERWVWSSGIGWSTRSDPLDSDRGSLDTGNVGVATAYRISRRFSLRGSGSWNKDLSDLAARPEYKQVQIGLSWSPFGSRELGPLGRIREDPTRPAFEE